MSPTVKSWNCNALFGSADVELEDGELSPTAVPVFECGHCHSLALALLPLLPAGSYLVGSWDDEDAYKSWTEGERIVETSPMHVLCCLEDGRLIDIRGIRDELSYREQYPRDELYAMDEEEVIDLENFAYRDLRIEDARPFAEALVREEELACVI